MQKRVVFILYFYRCAGGAHRYLHSVFEYWRSRGYAFEVWYYRMEGEEPPPDYARKLPHVYPLRWLYINRSLQLACSTAVELLRRRRGTDPMPDVLVTMDAGETLLIGVVAALFGPAMVHNDRGMKGYFRKQFNALDYAFYRLAARLSRTVVTTWVANSAAKADELMGAGVPVGSIHIVPNGIKLYPMPRVPVGAGTESGYAPRGAVLFGYFSRPDIDRGMDVLFDLIRLLYHSEPSLNALFVATVEERHIPPDLRTCEWIIPLGTLAHDDVAAWMMKTDIVLVPTRHEAFGNTVIESLYYGAWVLASATGNLLYLRDEQRLVLVDNHEDPQAWLAAVRALLPHIREAEAERSVDTTIAERYSFEHQADALYSVFASAAEER